MNENAKPILVVGGGIAGISAAIEAAEAGCQVILLEKSAYLGGRVARMYRYFPKLCPPTCGLEINYKRIKNNSMITVLTLAEAEYIEHGVFGEDDDASSVLLAGFSCSVNEVFAKCDEANGA